MKKETKFNVIRLKQRDGSPSFKVREITLQGSHDNRNFEHITDIIMPNASGEQLFELPAPVEYQYLRLIFKSWMDNSKGNVYLSQFNLSFYGYAY